MIHMSKNDLIYYVGQENIEQNALPVYDDLVLAFLNDLSKELRNDPEARRYPDIMTFAFWCRKANLVRLKEQYTDAVGRIGKGIVFHIAPSNVPVNFAFSLAFGLLAGNGNVVRVSEKQFEQVSIICRNLNQLLQKSEYKVLQRQNQVVSYPHDSQWNDHYSQICDMRVIWGGDRTIQELRKSPLKCRATEITFADRYSFAVFDEDQISRLEDAELRNLAEQFYNDTYLMDQNACSSPHWIFWKSEKGGSGGRNRFWQALGDLAKQKYDLAEKKVMDKYTMLCEMAASHPDWKLRKQADNALYVVSVEDISEDLEDIRGRFGLFYETEWTGWQEVSGALSDRTQTCVTYGVDRQALLQEIIRSGRQGIDRIVPVGKAMDIGVYWDGYDIIGTLSRKIMIEE